MKYTVTIAMPIYNVAPYVEKSLLSALNQTFVDIEYLLVDDKGTDESMRVCRNDASSFLYKQSPDFPKPGLCHVQKNLHL